MKSGVVTIPRQVSGGEELVVLRKRDLEPFRKWQREVQDALAKVRRGRKEYRSGRTSTVASPRKLAGT